MASWAYKQVKNELESKSFVKIMERNKRVHKTQKQRN